MYRKVVIILLVFFAVSSHVAAQSDSDAQSAFDEMINHPEEYNSIQRVKIYNDAVAPYYSQGLDTVLQAYIQMQEFGEALNDSFVIAMAYSSQAAIYKMQGKKEQTFELGVSATQYLKSYPEELVRQLAAVGTEATYLGRYEIAEEYIERAFKEQVKVESDETYAELFIVRGAFYERQSQYHSALTSYLKALDYKELVRSPLKVSNIYLNISQMYNRLDDTDKALEYLKYVDDIAEENGYKMTANRLDLRRGSYYMKQDDFEKAKFHFLASLDYLKQKGKRNTLLGVYAHLSMINLYLDDLEAAKEYIDLAHTQIDPTTEKSSKSPLFNTEYRYAQAIGRFSESKKPLLELIELSKVTEDYSKEQNAINGLIKLYDHEGNWKEVAHYQNELIQSISKENLAAQKNLVYDLDNKYQNEQKEQFIEGLEAENQFKELQLSQKKAENRFYIVLLILALLALLGLRYAYKSIQKINTKLKDTNNQLSKALDINKMLLKEIHHRVKNNLQVISSLLGLQQVYLKDSEAKKAIQTSKTRVQSMSLLHQKLYQGEDITKVNIKDYFENLTLNLFQTYKVNQDQIELHQDIESLVLDVDTVITMGLIFNELISNALKYAFEEDEKGAIHVSVKEVGDSISMIIKDNGKGVDFEELPKRSSSLGMNLVRSFSGKLQGNVKIDNKNGTHFEITFPIEKKAA